MNFTHLDADLRPTMVDVSDKTVTQRTAVAEAKVHFPPGVAAALRDSGLRSAKGPVFDTAIVAGVMGAKRTRELIRGTWRGRNDRYSELREEHRRDPESPAGKKIEMYYIGG